MAQPWLCTCNQSVYYLGVRQHSRSKADAVTSSLELVLSLVTSRRVNHVSVAQ
jgi:hypothetical protein